MLIYYLLLHILGYVFVKQCILKPKIVREEKINIQDNFCFFCPDILLKLADRNSVFYQIFT